jgi:hypothetical protein
VAGEVFLAGADFLAADLPVAVAAFLPGAAVEPWGLAAGGAGEGPAGPERLGWGWGWGCASRSIRTRA